MAGLTNESPAFANPQASLGLTGTAWNSNGDGVVLNGMIGDVMEGLTGSQTIDASSGFDSYLRLVSPFRLSTTAMKDIDGLFHSAFPAFGKAAEGAAKAAEGAAAACSHLGQGFGNALGGIAGAIGNAAKVGAVSVPASWISTPAANPITLALNGVGAAAAEPATSRVRRVADGAGPAPVEVSRTSPLRAMDSSRRWWSSRLPGDNRRRDPLRGDQNFAVQFGIRQIVERRAHAVQADFAGDQGADVDLALGDRAQRGAEFLHVVSQ